MLAIPKSMCSFSCRNHLYADIQQFVPSFCHSCRISAPHLHLLVQVMLPSLGCHILALYYPSFASQSSLSPILESSESSMCLMCTYLLVYAGCTCVSTRDKYVHIGAQHLCRCIHLLVYIASVLYNSAFGGSSVIMRTCANALFSP